MKLLKRALALTLGCVLAFSMAACGGGDASAQDPIASPGRYVETDITPPGAEEDGLQSFMTPEGALVCFSTGLVKRWDSADGGATWQESEGPGAKEPKLAEVWNYTLLPNGDILAAMPNAAGDGTGELARVSPDGTMEHFPFPQLDEAIAEGKNPYVSLLNSLSEDRLLLNFSSNMMYAEGGGGGEDIPEDGSLPPEAEPLDDSEPEPESLPDDASDTSEPQGGFSSGYSGIDFTGLIDPNTGEVVAEFPEWYGASATVLGDKIYMMDYDGTISVKNLADGKDAGEDVSVPVGEFAFNLAMGAGADGQLYVLDGKRIHKVGPETPAETLLDGSAYSFAGRGMASALHVLPDGTIVINLSIPEGARLYKYVWDPDATVDPANVLKVWSLYEDSLIRAAVNALRAQNPDIVVEYEVALGDDTAALAEDAIKNLNTRLLNGDGPDVMVLDGCPVDSYTQKGMLMDLTDLVDTSGMFQNLLEPFVKDGKVYTLPGAFKVPLLLGTGEDLAKADTLDTLAQMVKEGQGLRSASDDEDVFANLPKEERPVLSPEDLKEMFDYLWEASAASIVTDDGLDTDATKTFLSALQTISDKYELGDGGGSMSGAMAVMSSDGAAATVRGAVLSYASQRSIFGAYLADDLQMLDYMMEPPGSEMASFPGLTKGSWLPRTLVGVNADTEKKELAASLLQAMLGDEVQGVRTGTGFSVTKSGMDKMIADTNELMQEYQETTFDFDYAPLVALAQQPVIVDETLTEKVWLAAQALCAGDVDLEGAVKQLEQDLKNYLAERQ